MLSLQDLLTSWTTATAPLISLISLVQSRGWLVGISASLAIGSVALGQYAAKQSRLIGAASAEIEGRSIDSLNAANLRRRLNTTLLIQEAEHIATIEGADLRITWRYAGYCRAEREAAIEFSVDAERNIPFHRLECVGYDLMRDPAKRHRIRPVLIGPDGISKKVALPFLKPLSSQEPFNALLQCRIPGCFGLGVGYFTSTLSFAQDSVRRVAVRLRFIGDRPEFVRAYEQEPTGSVRLLADLRPVSDSQRQVEYLDVSEHMNGQSARIYTFRRS